MTSSFIPSIILASSSPRRQELLAGLGLPFEIQVSHVDEAVPSHYSPEQVVEYLAEKKASAVAETRMEGLVIGSDTIVVLEDQLLGKPQNETEAKMMLLRLQGQTHQVYTGLAVVDVATRRCKIGHQVTHVTMGPLNEETVNQYLASKEPLDKAGAYAIQGLGATLIEKINGDYFTVVGLPLCLTAQFLREFGVDILAINKED